MCRHVRQICHGIVQSLLHGSSCTRNIRFTLQVQKVLHQRWWSVWAIPRTLSCCPGYIMLCLVQVLQLSRSHRQQSEQCTPEKHRRALGTTCVHTALPIQKSVKRRRAESVLAAQYTNDESSDAGAARCKRQKLHSAEATTVAACTLASCRWGMGCLQPCPGKPIHC